MPMEIERSYRYECDNPVCPTTGSFDSGLDAQKAGWLMAEVSVNFDNIKFVVIACRDQCLVNGFARLLRQYS